MFAPKPSPVPVDVLKYLGTGSNELSTESPNKKTNYFWDNRNGFLFELSKEIGLLKKRAARDGFKFAVRLNGTSDLPWHKYKVDGGGSLMDIHPDVQFYDYTKVLNYLIMVKKIIM
jgi:hypothetical protein